MLGIGLPELLVIMAVALIVVGPDKLPGLARSIARTLMDLKQTAEEVKNSFTEETNSLSDIKPELEDAAKRLRETVIEPQSDLWQENLADGGHSSTASLQSTPDSNNRPAEASDQPDHVISAPAAEDPSGEDKPASGKKGKSSDNA